FIFALIIFASIDSPAQRRRFGELAPPPSPQEVQLAAEMAKLRDAALASDYAWKELDHLCNNIGPRLSGSEQAHSAVQYVADELRKLGVDVKLEKVMVPH